MRLLLHANTSEYFDVDAAYVEITPEDAKRYLGYIDVVEKLKEEHDGMAYLTFWDGSATYLTKVGEAYENVYDDEVVEVPEGDKLLELDDYDSHARTACNMLKVWDDRILWVAYSKYSDDRVETAGLDRDYLEKIAKREDE